MIIADQHDPKAAKQKPGETRRQDGKTQQAPESSARSALPHAGEKIGAESDTDTRESDKR